MTLTAPPTTHHPQWVATPPPLHLPHYGIGFLAAIRRGFGKYATFYGRASLSEFWWWSLFRVLTILVLAALGYGGIAVGTGLGTDTGDTVAGVAAITLWLAVAGFEIATYLPMLAITFRRLHDAGRHPAWYLISFVPLFGWLVLICLLAERTTTNAYRYGPPFIMIDPSRPGWTSEYAPPAAERRPG